MPLERGGCGSQEINCYFSRRLTAPLQSIVTYATDVRWRAEAPDGRRYVKSTLPGSCLDPAKSALPCLVPTTLILPGITKPSDLLVRRNCSRSQSAPNTQGDALHGVTKSTSGAPTPRTRST